MSILSLLVVGVIGNQITVKYAGPARLSHTRHLPLIYLILTQLKCMLCRRGSLVATVESCRYFWHKIGPAAGPSFEGA